VSEAGEPAAPPAEEAPAERALCILFTRGDDRYAVRADEVHKVTEPGWLNRLPRLPPAVVGITHHRGRVVTVVDLAVLFSSDPPPRRESSASRLVILERGQRHVALWVDAVDQIANLRVPAGEGGMAVINHAGAALCALEAESLVRRVLGLAGEEG
jgi:chemotaxis signal transduction protein